MPQQIQQRGDTASNWISINPTLASRELGVETDTGRTKRGDGATVWTALKYSDNYVAKPRGAWSSVTTYEYSDVVTFGSTTWRSLSGGNLNNTPSPTSIYWESWGGSSLNEIYLNARDLSPIGWTYSEVNQSSWPGIPFAPSVNHYISRIITQPIGWPAMNVEIDWTKSTAFTGIIQFGYFSIALEQLIPHGPANTGGVDNFTSGADTLNLSPTDTSGIVATTPQRAPLTVSPQTFDGGLGKIIRLVVGRNGANAADTYGQTCYIQGVRLTPNFG